jgi:hypothetical protein
MDDIYEPVYDSVALEDHLLPEPVETFLLVALCWCLVAWLLRLCYMAIHLLELQTAIRTQRLSSHDNVPLHAEVAVTDPQMGSRFLSFLRTRTPATPTAAVPCYSVPLSLNGATRRGQKRRLLPGALVDLALACWALHTSPQLGVPPRAAQASGAPLSPHTLAVVRPAGDAARGGERAAPPRDQSRLELQRDDAALLGCHSRGVLPPARPHARPHARPPARPPARMPARPPARLLTAAAAAAVPSSHRCPPLPPPRVVAGLFADRRPHGSAAAGRCRILEVVLAG